MSAGRGTSTGTRRPVTAPARAGIGGGRGLTDHVMAQCGANVEEVLPTLPVGTGVVISGKTALEGMRQAKDAGWAGPCLVDRRRYAGTARAVAGDAITPGWVEDQRKAGAARPLTDSGYVADGDIGGLVNILESAVRLGPDVIAVLPLHPSWLQDGLRRLIMEVRFHGCPVGLVIEHRADPFAVRRTLAGCIQLLRAVSVDVEVVQLCSDVSALGAVAFGATAAAVGVRPSLRHLYPAGGGGFRRGVQAVLFDPGMAFVHVDKLARGVAAMPEDAMWLCDCMTCGGRRMDWLLYASEQEQRAHTFELLARRGDHLTSAAPGPVREQVWRAACASAEYQFTSVAVARVGWEVPAALRHWQRI